MQSVQSLMMTGNHGVFGVSGAVRGFGMSAAGVYANEVNHAWIVPLPDRMA